MGIYTSEEFDFVKISVNRCNNSTIANSFGQGVVCASTDVVAAQIVANSGTAVLSIYNSNTIINP